MLDPRPALRALGVLLGPGREPAALGRRGETCDASQESHASVLPGSLEGALLELEVLDRLDADDVHLRLLQLARVVPVHRLPPGELVQHPDARLAGAVARLAVAAE